MPAVNPAEGGLIVMAVVPVVEQGLFFLDATNVRQVEVKKYAKYKCSQ